MKILIVNSYDAGGGAARAAYRLHKALLSANIESTLLVQKKLFDDHSVIGGLTIKHKIVTQIKPYLDQLPLVFYRNKSANLFSTGWFSFGDILNQINNFQPDIVHLHWFCKGTLSVEEIGKIKVPIVWTMHDSWAFTGGCHIPVGCYRYKEECGICPELRSNHLYDLSWKGLSRKREIYTKINNITMVAVSQWLLNCAQNSTLLKDANLLCIPNAIDTKIFSPIAKSVARSVLNIGGNSRLVLFGAMSATNDLNKGYREFLDAISQLVNPDIEIVVFGSTQPTVAPTGKYKIHYLGHLQDNISLKILYSAADVMVVPSLMEAFGQTATEAMACGTPVVSFRTSGLVDIVEHKANGYLAQSFDATDLARGIDWVLSIDDDDYAQLVENARNTVLKKFDSEVISSRYITLYKQILSKEVLSFA
jgi:glycosyltransferase involved in cell wall biosynthesis